MAALSSCAIAFRASPVFVNFTKRPSAAKTTTPEPRRTSLWWPRAIRPPRLEPPHADAVGQPLGLVEVVRREQDRRVVLVAKVSHEGLYLALAADVETGRRLIEEEQRWRGEERPRDRDFLLHAAGELFERLGLPIVGDPQAPEDLARSLSAFARGDAVQACGVAQIFECGELLEERGLDRHTVDEPLHRQLVGPDVESEDPDRAGVSLEQRREHANERGLPGAIRPEERVDLTARHGQRDAVDRAKVLAGRAEPFHDAGGVQRRCSGRPRRWRAGRQCGARGRWRDVIDRIAGRGGHGRLLSLHRSPGLRAVVRSSKRKDRGLWAHGPDHARELGSSSAIRSWACASPGRPGWRRCG